MTWRTTDDIEEYVGAAGAFLRSRPVAHTVPLTVVEGLRAARGAIAGLPSPADRPVYGWWRAAAGPVTGAFLQTPPHPVLLTGMPAEAVAALPATLTGLDRSLPGVTGESAVVDGFAAAWRRHAGTTPQVRMRQRLYRLESLTLPRPAPQGAARVAGYADRPLLIEWYAAFAADAGVQSGPGTHAVDDRLSHGGLSLWEVDGTPVSLAGRTHMIARMVRVAPVYTPPEQRRRGFAAAVTAAVCRACLAGGALEVVLFTDLANPTSNGVYQRIGFRPVDDYLMLSLRPES